MILVDSNILMYAAGGEHPHKAPSLRWLKKVVDGEVDATIDAEILQEILHRYRSIRRWDEGRKVYDLACSIFPAILPVDSEVLDKARQLMDRHRSLMARDAVHAAVVLCGGLDGICSYDTDFDIVEGMSRIEP